MSGFGAAVVVVPLLTAAATTLASRRARLQRAISFAGALALLLAAAAATVSAAGGAAGAVGFGGWPPPFGIGFKLDGIGALLTLVAALMGMTTLVFLESDADRPAHEPMLLPLIHGLLAGVAGAFATADLFNLYVWFEVMLVCALGLLAAGGGRRQIDATFKYLTLNLLGTLLLVAAVAMVFASTGHLAFDGLRGALPRLPEGLRHALLAALVFALLVKAGAFPVFAWLPAAYPSLPAAVLMLFAALLTKVGAYAVLRLVADVFQPDAGWIPSALGWVACATMIAGVMGAAYHWDLRRIFAFHIVSQIGYILLAVAVGGVAGNAAALFYTVHHIVVKGNLFLVSGLICALAGSYDLRRVGGLARAQPWLAAAFAVPALSLVGVPPLSGFWAKLLVLQAAIEQGRYLWAATGLLVSVLTLYSMVKVWQEAFWKPHPDAALRSAAPVGPRARLHAAWWAVALLCVVTLAIGVAPETLLGYARAAALSLPHGTP